MARLEVTDALAKMRSSCARWSAPATRPTWDLRCEVREKLVGFLQPEQLQPSESADAPASRQVTTGDDGPAAPAKPPRPDQ